jgi:hypothetical protein
MEAVQKEDAMTQGCKAKQFLLRTGELPESSFECLTEKKERRGLQEPPCTRDYSLDSLPTSEPQVSDRPAVLYY